MHTPQTTRDIKERYYDHIKQVCTQSLIVCASTNKSPQIGHKNEGTMETNGIES